MKARIYINRNTKFIGQDLGKYKKVFNQCLWQKDTKFQHFWFNLKNHTMVIHFIMSFNDGFECAGTIISTNDMADAVYIVGIKKEGQFKF